MFGIIFIEETMHNQCIISWEIKIEIFLIWLSVLIFYIVAQFHLTRHLEKQGRLIKAWENVTWSVISYELIQIFSGKKSNVCFW